MGEVTRSFDMTELSSQGWVLSSDDSRDCCSADVCQDGAASDCHDRAGAVSEEFHPLEAADAEAGAIISAARYAGSPSHGG